MSRLTWADPSKFTFETGLDRGVLYKQGLRTTSLTEVEMTLGQHTFDVQIPRRKEFRVGSLVQGSTPTNTYVFKATVVSCTSTEVVLDFLEINSGGFGSNWTLSETIVVPWFGLISVDEKGSEESTVHMLDGLPTLYVPQPKVFEAQLQAYTYPDEFSEVMGFAEIADGMYADSQMGDSFNLAYRTKVGNALVGDELGYKIHLIYNAVVTGPGTSYSTQNENSELSDFTWTINAAPIVIPGIRPTSHLVIDTRHIVSAKLEMFESIIYGSETTPAYFPTPQFVYDLLSYGDEVVFTDNGDGTWQAEGSYQNIYSIAEDVYQIDNVDVFDHGDGTFSIGGDGTVNDDAITDDMGYFFGQPSEEYSDGVTEIVYDTVGVANNGDSIDDTM